jgi:hypothetical protein
MPWVIYTDFGIYDDTLSVPVCMINEPAFDADDIHTICQWMARQTRQAIRNGEAADIAYLFGDEAYKIKEVYESFLKDMSHDPVVVPYILGFKQRDGSDVTGFWRQKDDTPWNAIVWQGGSYQDYIRYGFVKVENFPLDLASAILEDENED